MQCPLVHQYESGRSRSSSSGHHRLGCDLLGQSKYRCNSLLGKQYHPSSGPGGTYQDTGILEQKTSYSIHSRRAKMSTHETSDWAALTQRSARIYLGIRLQSETHHPKAEMVFNQYPLKEKLRQSHCKAACPVNGSAQSESCCYFALCSVLHTFVRTDVCTNPSPLWQQLIYLQSPFRRKRHEDGLYMVDWQNFLDVV